MGDRATQVTDEGGSAVCLQCGWTQDARSSTSALGAATKHHDATGHEVTANLHRRVVYGGNVAQQGTQEAML